MHCRFHQFFFRHGNIQKPRFNGALGSDWISAAQSMKSYSTSGFMATVVSNYIRRLGYEAEPHFSGHYKVVMPPLVLLSGLGEVSRFGGVVLNPFLGPRFKASAVTTNLPLEPDSPIEFGVADACRQCRRCAEACESGAVSSEMEPSFDVACSSNNPGVLRWAVDHDKCYAFWLENGASCSNCIAMCPFTRRALKDE